MVTEKYCLLLYCLFAFHLSFDGRNCINGVMTATDSCKEYRARMDYVCKHKLL